MRIARYGSARSVRAARAARHPRRIPLGGEHGPALEIAPTASELGEAQCNAFLAKAEARDELDRAAVDGLDVGFEPMQLEGAKRMRDRENQALAYVALPRVRHERVVAQVRGLIRAARDVVDRDDPRQGAGSAHRHEKRGLVLAAQEREEAAIALRRRGRPDKTSVQGPAHAHGGQEFGLASPRRVFEVDTGPHARRRATSPRGAARNQLEKEIGRIADDGEEPAFPETAGRAASTVCDRSPETREMPS